LCPPYYPQSKGKIEASVKFIRNNFFQGEKFGKTFSTLDELNGRLLKWLNEYANVRKHPLSDETVFSLWQKERGQLLVVPDYATALVSTQIRRVSQISMVSYKKASYWIPPDYIRHKVEVREITKNGDVFLEFYDKGEKIFEHMMKESGSWNLPDDLGKNKGSGIDSDVVKRVKNHVAYQTKVDVRAVEYYTRMIQQPSHE
jgi:hypothetical protein